MTTWNEREQYVYVLDEMMNGMRCYAYGTLDIMGFSAICLRIVWIWTCWALGLLKGF